MDDIGTLIDLERYPLDRKDSAGWRALVAEAQRQHEAEGACNLPGFLTLVGLEAARAEAAALLDAHGYQKTYVRNAFFSADDPSLPPEHPRRRFWPAGACQVADDQIGTDTVLRRIYRWQPLIDFVAAVEERAALYPMADRFQALNVVGHGDGEQLPWHYDANDFTVTLLLQSPEAGGDFVFAPDIRSATDENMAAVQRVFDGDEALVRRLPRGEGTLTLFRGRNSLHRVDPCRGTRRRISAILTYDTQPDCRRPLAHNIGIYGPRLEALARAGAAS